MLTRCPSSVAVVVVSASVSEIGRRARGVRQHSRDAGCRSIRADVVADQDRGDTCACRRITTPISGGPAESMDHGWLHTLPVGDCGRSEQYFKRLVFIVAERNPPCVEQRDDPVEPQVACRVRRTCGLWPEQRCKSGPRCQSTSLPRGRRERQQAATGAAMRSLYRVGGVREHPILYANIEIRKFFAGFPAANKALRPRLTARIGTAVRH